LKKDYKKIIKNVKKIQKKKDFQDKIIFQKNLTHFNHFFNPF